MKILVTFALENEFAPWRKLRSFERVSIAEWDKTYRTRIGDADVRVFLTGAGRFATQRAIAIALDEKPDVCIASGLAGGLRTELALGAILVPRTLSDAREAKLSHCSPDLVQLAQSLGAAVVGRFLTVEQVIANSGEKRRLGAVGDAIDMETLWVLSAAIAQGIRSVAVRAISDIVDSDLPLDFAEVFDRAGEVSVGKVVGQVARRPQRLPALLRLAHQSQRAASALATFLDKYIQQIPANPFDQYAKADAIAL
jgi:nucleoside phosphorylase